MKSRISKPLVPIFLLLASYCIATAQDVAQSDQITQAGLTLQADGSTTGKFEPVTLAANATSDVVLQFPVSLANKAVAVSPLDGGLVLTADSAIDSVGNLSFSFQVSDRSGVYRVVVTDPNADEDSPHIIGVVQFEVPTS